MKITPRTLQHLIKFHNLELWPKDLAETMKTCCYVKKDFITEAEEKSLLVDVEPHMKRLRYEKSHWDDAIHLYREREQRKWRDENLEVISRIRSESFGANTEHLTYVHILDLHKDGVIKPHIDAIRYCGDVITGVSLLSDAIMRLRHKDQKDELIMDLLMPRRSLYRLGGPGRYDFTHEVLGEQESVWNGEQVPRERRISIICRDLPKVANRQTAEEEIKLKPIPEEI
ncbi:Alpha-ketoglutarate-dependent dioxygenase AlkB-like domain-containing protein [Caenorhabditis elegans]|uniref:Alpha-ketoglutarate-dependent dioxygenase AlkB-like domain-containing protein n=1 Tax=Caenorhabditis elegans TaxID=6239 RepID=Q7YWP5_CAEEL|nr:Alpha-ketoglutarate-dependent dioxygenase AlkB-like domain-containing protein [Caenorhabditis elegans]CAE18012.1 Alpha-ketoglutarate-dependent dioxygenase AlkB-like domain-containing protein [Caenorhabditis elegans]|eukprot:NP_001022442.1 ALKylated DNA repair protein AlkB homolog [Caenorhabditis elegans]